MCWYIYIMYSVPPTTAGGRLSLSRGGTGIYIDENLRFGRTEKCATFDNSPLAGESDFTVSVIEVYGFNQLDSAKGW